MRVSPPSPPHLSRAHGLTIACNRPLSGLVESALPSADLRIHMAAWNAGLRGVTTPSAPPTYTSPFSDAHGVPLAVGWDLANGWRHIRINSGTEALIDAAGTEAWISASADSAVDLDGWILGPLLAIVLRRRGAVCLHASVVSMDGGAVALAGRQGAGKSTLAALLAMRGAPVVTDDLAVLDGPKAGGRFEVHPGAAIIRTRHGLLESLAAALGRRAHLSPSPDGRYLDLDLRQPPYAIAAEPVPLRALYYLEVVPDGGARGRPASIRPLRGADALMRLVADTWATRWLNAAERAAELDLLAKLLATVPCWTAEGARDEAGVLGLAEAIAAHEPEPR